MYKYKAKVRRFIDGDTYELMIDLGLDTYVVRKVRLLGIDTPETWRPSCEEERKRGIEATAFVTKEIGGKDIYIETTKQGKYGRYLCTVTYDENKDLTEELIKAGFEKPESYNDLT